VTRCRRSLDEDTNCHSPCCKLGDDSRRKGADQSLPAYQTVPGIAGQIKSVGSDTLNEDMELWAKGFNERYPDAKIIVEGKGSATAPPALLDGSAQFGPMSRPMNEDESAAFQQKYGYKPSNFAVAYDALAVYVNKENPIKCLTVGQVDRIFSARALGSGGRRIDTWGDAGLAGEWAAQRIVMYGRNEISGTHELFRQQVLYNGEFRPEVQQQPGSEEVVSKVASDKFAIGYSGIGYKTDGVRAVPLAISSGRKCYDTSAESTYAGHYPVARFLYIYLNKKPNEPLDPSRSEFIKYVLSSDGQAQTEKTGFYPITNEIREKELKKLGISTRAN
jgi:phosphate transport system substrate-binding protein